LCILAKIYKLVVDVKTSTEHDNIIYGLLKNALVEEGKLKVDTRVFKDTSERHISNMTSDT